MSKDTPSTFAEATEVLAQRLPGYEERPSQSAAAREIETALSTREHLLVEAPTGTGKSVAYSVPAILSGKRTVISTETKALQGQLVNTDLPWLQENLAPFSYALLKGRSNYLCMARLNDPSASDLASTPAVAKVVSEREDDATFLGEQEDFEVTDSDWRNLTVTSAECPGKRACPFGQVCFAEKAKAKAQSSQIVVVNHALLMTDLKVRVESGGFGSMLGPYDALVVDEAHTLEDVASGILGDQVSEHTVKDLSAKALNSIRRTSAGDLDEAREIIREVTSSMTSLWQTLTPGRIRSRHIVEHGDQWVAMINATEALAELVASQKPDGDRERAAHSVLLSSLRNLAHRFHSMAFADFAEMLRWVEEQTMNSGAKRVVLRIAPISVAGYLRDHLFSGDAPAILTSGTLTAGGDFTFVRQRLGIDAARELVVPSPFDYATQSRLYVPRHLPDPSRERAAWSSMAVNEMLELVRASQGRALLLFTSYSAMRNAYEMISGQIEYTCLMQGQQPNKVLSERFMEDTHSVLFATRSFMTGVDFRGDACSLVVLDKLPFPVPTEPVFEARSEAIEAAGGNPFSQFTIPLMSLTLIQALGRLIRHTSDRGVAALLDPRVVTKGYGKRIIASLPPMPLVTSQSDVLSFFADES